MQKSADVPMRIFIDFEWILDHFDWILGPEMPPKSDQKNSPWKHAANQIGADVKVYLNDKTYD